MRLGWRAWAAARLAPLQLGATAVVLAPILLRSELTLVFPSLLTGNGLEVPNAVVFPLVPVVTTAYALSLRDEHLEHAGCRPTWVADIVLPLAMAIVLGVGGMFVENANAGVSARNVLGLSGLTLAAAALGLRRGAAFPAVGFALICLFEGSTSPFRSPWSWPVKAPGDVLACCLAIATYAIGAAVFAVRERRP